MLQCGTVLCVCRGLSTGMELASLEPVENHQYEEIQKYTKPSGQSSEIKEHLDYSIISCPPAEYCLASPSKPPLTTTPTTTTTGSTTGTTNGDCTTTHCVTAACPAYGMTGSPPNQDPTETLTAKEPVYDLPMTKLDLGEISAKETEEEPEYEVMKSLEALDKIP